MDMNTLTDRLTAYYAHLDAQLALCDAATAGPWREGTFNVWQDDLLLPICEMRHRSYKDGGVTQMLVKGDSSETMQNDAAFIAAARTGYPDTLRNLKRAMEALEEFRNKEHDPDDLTGYPFHLRYGPAYRTILAILDAHDLSTEK